MFAKTGKVEQSCLSTMCHACSRFRALLGDLFPGIKVTDTQNADLEKAIHAAAAAMRLELTAPQVRVCCLPNH